MANSDAGDRAFPDGHTINMPSDGTVAAGQVCKLNASGQLEAAVAGDAIFGVVADADLTNVSAGDKIAVHVNGVVYVTASGVVDEGNMLVADAAGKVQASGNVNQAVDEGGTAVYTVYTRALLALDSAAADGDLVRALFI